MNAGHPFGRSSIRDDAHVTHVPYGRSMPPPAARRDDEIAFRTAAVMRAVRATLEGDSGSVDELFAPNVHARVPVPADSALALSVEIEDRAGVFVDVDLWTVRTRVIDSEVWVEWTASVVHVGSLALDDVVIEASGRRAELHGITVADFIDRRIVTFRQYCDVSALLSPRRAGRRLRRQRG